MNLKNKIQYLFIVMFLLSCDALEEIDCNGVAGGEAIEDDCGVCSGGDTGIEPNAGLSCDGQCEGNSLWWSMDDLGDGLCDEGSWFVAFNCERFNCDNGDCGSWDGTQCISPDGGAAIKWDHYLIDNISETFWTDDPSKQEDFMWDTFYSAIPGTYAFSYPNGDGGLWEGTYTTYKNAGVVNSSEPDNECFELSLYTYSGPYFDNYSWLTGCSEFFDSLGDSSNTSITAEGEKLNKYLEKIETDHQNDQIAYQEYLSEKDDRKAEESRLQALSGNTHKMTTINSDVIVNNNFDYDRIIEAVDTYPNVQIQKGENFILKYYKRNILK